MMKNMLYYITPLAWGGFLLLRWSAFYLYSDDLAIQRQGGVCGVVLLFIPYVLYIVNVIQHIRHFREEKKSLLVSTIYILLYHILISL